MERWFSRGIIEWYQRNKRDLPWRKETDPYKIWLSEVILQQTQVVQGQSYYLKFIKNYPTVRHLARAGEDQVMKDWQGLGYYSRARNLHTAAKMVTNEKGGVFPKTLSEIRELKGVGDYTAAAVASFAYNLPHAVVDGNVYRLLSRLFGISTPIDSSEGKKQFAQLAEELLDRKNAAIHNQAIMEFGSQFCRPVNPDCSSCIFKSRCSAFQTSEVQALPVKAKKITIKNRYLNYLVVVDKEKKVLVRKRTASDIWQGLYEFALIETARQENVEKLLSLPEARPFLKNKSSVVHVSKAYKHILSHQHLYARFYVIKTTFSLGKDYTTCSLRSLTKYAFPRLIEKFLNDCKLNEIV